MKKFFRILSLAIGILLFVFVMIGLGSWLYNTFNWLVCFITMSIIAIVLLIYYFDSLDRSLGGDGL